jgi:hypothetical protein
VDFNPFRDLTKTLEQFKRRALTVDPKPPRPS